MVSINADIGQILVDTHKLTNEEYQDLKTQAQKDNLPLVQVIQQSGLVEKVDLSVAKAKSLNLEFVNLLDRPIDRKVLEIIPENLARTYQMVAFSLDAKTNILQIAMADPQDLKGREASRYIAREHNVKPQWYLTDQDSINLVLKKYANIGREVGEALESAKARFESISGETGEEAAAGKVNGAEELQEIIRHAPVAKMVQVIIRHAVEGKASDIHIEPMDKMTRVRFRIDGSLSTSITLPLYVHDALIARIKVMANLKIDETRIPQDGRIRLELLDRDVEFRVSVIPLQGHEKIVMRVLDTGGKPPPLDKLGYIGRNFDVIKKNLLKPNGMVLVTGPTGSGKSMTLFACLNIVNSEDVNISTLEDPVEYRLAGVNHSQINPQVGFTFAAGLRALLRQDPNIIMVGEIRDFETAELAIHAAMTGHLVLSTLHTNSAVGAIPRLLDMRVEPFLLTSTLNVLIAQRLVRTICQDCKQEAELDIGLTELVKRELRSLTPEQLQGYGGVNLDHPVFYYGKGCARCGHTGFRGRTAICEIVDNDNELKNVIIGGMKQDELATVLKHQQFITMRQDGFVKCLLGHTAPEEVLSVTKVDE